MARPRGPAAPSSLRSWRDRTPRAVRRRVRSLSGWIVVVGMMLGLRCQHRSRLDGQAIGGHVGRIERQHLLHRAPPVVDRLSGCSVDDVEVERRNPRASPIAATARSTLAGSWVRPVLPSTCGDIDCTPTLTRFTHPPYRYDISTVTSSGLHSTVTSGPSRRGIVAISSDSVSAATSVGVPPPTKIVSATGSPRRRRAGFRWTWPPDIDRRDGPDRSTSRMRSSRTSKRRRGCAGTPQLVHPPHQNAVFGRSCFRRFGLRPTGRAGRARRGAPLIDRHVEHRCDRPDIVATDRDDPAVEVLPLHLDQLQIPRQHLEGRTLELDQLDDVDRQQLLRDRLTERRNRLGSSPHGQEPLNGTAYNCANRSRRGTDRALVVRPYARAPTP